MRKLFKQIREVLTKEDAVLVTVVASSGSTPRGSGAKMLVTSDGRVYGTIGGGKVEYESEQVALEVLRTKKSHTEHYLLRKNQVQDLGMICGGEVFVYFHYLPKGEEAVLAVADRVEKLFEARERSWLISDSTPETASSMRVYGEKSGLTGAEVPAVVLERLNNKSQQIETEDGLFYCEPLFVPGNVYIFGGGHVSQALVPVLSGVSFNCVVLEDREMFCRKELFPQAYDVRQIDNSRVADFVNITEEDYVVIMTRGHKDDQTVQAQAMQTPARYIGVMGSKRKRQGVFDNLRKMGFSEESLARIHTPIGLDIKAETPAEIAISIAGELIIERAKS